MGKKPVGMLVGLVWAGIALTGCDCCKSCRNCRNKDVAPPAVATRNVTPTPGGAQSPVLVNDTKTSIPASTKMTETAPSGFSTGGVQPAGGTPAGMTTDTNPPASPVSQNSLRPTIDSTPMPTPGATTSLPTRMDDGLSGSAMSSAGESRRMPPVPVVPKPVDANPPAMGTATPSMGSTSSLPPAPPMPSTPAQPPVPETSGSMLPPIR